MAKTVVQYAQIAKLDAVEGWAREAGLISSPSKEDQGCLDSILCAIVGYHWRTKRREESITIGDLTSGYMIVPSQTETKATLNRASQKHRVSCV